MNIQEISHSACESIYKINNTTVRVWAIVGGTLAISYLDYSFQTRLFYCEARDSSKNVNWRKWGGIPLDLIGTDTILNWVEENNPRKVLQDKRYAMLPDSYKSKRMHDTIDHCYFNIEWDKKHYVTGLYIISSQYSMRLDSAYAPMIPSNSYFEAQRLIGSITPPLKMLWELTSDEWNTYLRALNKLK